MGCNDAYEMMMEKYERHPEIKQDILRFLSELRAHIVIAGGVELTNEQLCARHFADILGMVFGNNIILSVRRREGH
jgi:hypothetical protein